LAQKYKGVNLAQSTGFGLDLCGLGKKAHNEKKNPLKKSIGLKTSQKSCETGPIHGLSSST